MSLTKVYIIYILTYEKWMIWNMFKIQLFPLRNVIFNLMWAGYAAPLY